MPAARRKDTREKIIARIDLSTSPRASITLRAKRAAGGRIRYRLVDEANRQHPIRTARSSRKPLALEEVIEMLDAACYHGACAGPEDRERYGGVIWGTLQLHFDHGVEPAESYLGFVTVTSDAYPELEAHYVERLGEWSLKRCMEHEDCRKVVRMRPRRG